MALPAPNLDDRRFQQFVDDAKRYIQQRCPEWTDHNVSDPGVTLVEAVAHMADQIVYRLNRVPERNYLAFLDLLGITLFPPAPARTDMTFWLSAPQNQPLLLPVGTEVATQRTDTEPAVVFATERDLTVVPCSLERVLLQPGGEPPVDHTAEILDSKDTPVFGDPPQPGDSMLFGLTAAVPDCAVVLRLGSRVDGVGVDPRQPPLLWEALTGDGWRPCEVERDTTGGLNRPGEVVLLVPSGHTVARSGRFDAGWLRCRVTQAEPGQPFYTLSPPSAPPRRSPSAAPPAPSTPTWCGTRRSASPTASPGSGCGWHTRRWRRANRRWRSRSPTATAGPTGPWCRTSPPPAPTTGTPPWTRPLARSPSARPCANPTGRCAATARFRPRAR